MVNITKKDSIELYTISKGAISASFIPWGARWISFRYENKELLLGYDNETDYLEDSFYIGACVGPYANRIENASFQLGDKTYKLPPNEGANCLHSSTFGFSKKMWTCTVEGEDSVIFSLTRRDGEGGYPGDMKATVRYTLTDNSLQIAYRCTSDQDTYFSPTNHAYFNLDGFDGKDCREMHMEILADRYVPVRPDLIPLGILEPVEGTAFDFQTSRPIQQDYDHCFVFKNADSFSKKASLYSPHSRIKMDIFTDMPSIQVYTCSKLKSENGRGQIPLHHHQGIAMETQFLPNSPNVEKFPSTLLKSGELFESITEYAFSKE